MISPISSACMRRQGHVACGFWLQARTAFTPLTRAALAVCNLVITTLFISVSSEKILPLCIRSSNQVADLPSFLISRMAAFLLLFLTSH